MKTKKGSIIAYLIIIIAVFMMMMLPVVADFMLKLNILPSSINKEQAFQIAEAGINYYQWHLAHFPDDYQDGTGQPGPYVHDYKDFDTQEKIGEFSLEITSPDTGSTIVIIKSTGKVEAQTGLERTITVKYGVPSLAQFAFLSNDVIWIGGNENVGGQLLSNNGVRFDGTGSAPIQSAKETYTCPSSQGPPCPALKPGVWGSAPPSVQSFWQFPVPIVDFASLTSDLAGMKSSAQDNGIYLPPSNKKGYSLVFNADGTVSIYKVKNLRSNPTGWDVEGNAHNEDVDYSARDILPGYDHYALPLNGIIYIEDDIWVEGIVNGRVTVAASVLPYSPSTAPVIYIPNNIVYSAKDGSSVLGLISQKNIVVTYYAPNDLEIDAALIAQNGSCQFFYWPGNIKDNITIYGSIMTFGQWTWTWVNYWGNVVSGYRNTYSNYDSNLLYSPPPNFPISSSGYQMLNWVSD